MSEYVVANEDVPMTYLHLGNASSGAINGKVLAFVNQLASEIQLTHLIGKKSRSKIELNIHFQGKKERKQQKVSCQVVVVVVKAVGYLNCRCL